MIEENEKEFPFNPTFVAGFISGLFDGNEFDNGKVPKGTKRWRKAIFISRTREILESEEKESHHREILDRNNVGSEDGASGIAFSDIDDQRYFAPLEQHIEANRLPFDYELFNIEDYE